MELKGLGHHFAEGIYERYGSAALRGGLVPRWLLVSRHVGRHYRCAPSDDRRQFRKEVVAREYGDSQQRAFLYALKIVRSV